MTYYTPTSLIYLSMFSFKIKHPRLISTNNRLIKFSTFLFRVYLQHPNNPNNQQQFFCILFHCSSVPWEVCKSVKMEKFIIYWINSKNCVLKNHICIQTAFVENVILKLEKEEENENVNVRICLYVENLKRKFFHFSHQIIMAIEDFHLQQKQ